jgi:tRNA dimethylallyltransferase
MKPYKLQPNFYKLIVLVGPTASGKSELGVLLAKKFNGEIISCDSRQIYRGMDLGTGKVIGNWQSVSIANHPERVHLSEGSLKYKKKPFLCGRSKKAYLFIYKSIPHHLIDFVNPTKQYSSATFQKQAQKVIKDILKRGKLPILCGGTAHWIDAVIYNQILPEVKPNLKLRASLEKKSVGQLFAQLKKLDPVRAASIDAKNPHRLIRALEIVISTGKPVPPLSVIPSAPEGSLIDRKLRDSSARMHSLGMTHYKTLWLAIKTEQKNLYKKIDIRLEERLKAGMIKEIENLHNFAVPAPLSLLARRDVSSASERQRGRKSGLSWKRLESFGLEYKYVSLYLQKKLSYDEMFTQLSFAIKHYSKRQLTWWKRNKEINWIKPEIKIGVKIISKFLNTN